MVKEHNTEIQVLFVVRLVGTWWISANFRCPFPFRLSVGGHKLSGKLTRWEIIFVHHCLWMLRTNHSHTGINRKTLFGIIWINYSAVVPIVSNKSTIEKLPLLRSCFHFPMWPAQICCSLGVLRDARSESSFSDIGKLVPCPQVMEHTWPHIYAMVLSAEGLGIFCFKTLTLETSVRWKQNTCIGTNVREKSLANLCSMPTL